MYCCTELSLSVSLSLSPSLSLINVTVLAHIHYAFNCYMHIYNVCFILKILFTARLKQIAPKQLVKSYIKYVIFSELQEERRTAVFNF